jgi:hypothetical protein
MARTTQGNASWGVSDGSTVTNVNGVITDIDVGEDPQMEPQRNEIGAVIKQTLYDRRAEVNVTVEVAAGVSKPAAGTAITAAGVQGYVTRSRVVESNQRYRAINITIEAYKNCKAVDDLTGGAI